MRSNSKFAAIGGYQQVLFCAGMYLLSLFFSIFICSAIFYAINPKKSFTVQKEAASGQVASGKTAGNSTVMLSINR
jgi:hypothetical protein